MSVQEVVRQLDDLIHLAPKERRRVLEGWRAELVDEIREEGATKEKLWALDQVEKTLACPSREARIPKSRQPQCVSAHAVRWRQARRPGLGRTRLLKTLRITVRGGILA